MRRLRDGGIALAVAALLLALWLAPASAATQTANVVARNAQGQVLPPDPLLKAGETVSLTVTGFGPHARLAVRLGTTQLGSFTADGSGVARFTVTVPRSYGPGTYVVAAVGSPPIRAVTPSAPHGNATRDPQVIEAEVPTLGLFTFHLGTAHTSPPPTSSHPTAPSSGQGGTSGSQSQSSGGAGGLGHTGVNVLGLLAAAAVALLGGILIMLPGRRRKHA